MAGDLSPDARVFTRIWLIRFGISLVSTAVIVWGMSFWIADYVVKAHGSGMNAAFSGIEASLDRINGSIQENTSEMIKLTSQTATQGTEIGYLRRDIGRIEKAVQNYGIAIPAVGTVDGGFVINTARWSEITEKFGASKDALIILEIKNPSPEK